MRFLACRGRVRSWGGVFRVADDPPPSNPPGIAPRYRRDGRAVGLRVPFGSGWYDDRPITIGFSACATSPHGPRNDDGGAFGRGTLPRHGYPPHAHTRRHGTGPDRHRRTYRSSPDRAAEAPAGAPRGLLRSLPGTIAPFRPSFGIRIAFNVKVLSQGTVPYVPGTSLPRSFPKGPASYPRLP